VYTINSMGREPGEVEQPSQLDGSKSGLESWSVLYVVAKSRTTIINIHTVLCTAAMHEWVYERREDAAKPTWMSARALARLAVPRKLTSTVLVFQANNT